jgi:uncharacterized protein YrrD
MRLVRGAELIGLPVAAIDEGRFLGEVRDVLFDPLRWRLLGFTLRGRGLISSPMLGVLPAPGIWALGRDAVMVGSADIVLREREDIDSALGEHEDAVGREVVTDAGQPLGEVRDIILETDGRMTTIVGCAVRRRDGHELFVPLLPDGGPNWGEALVVPTTAKAYATEGLSGFRQSLERTRAAAAEAAQ